jgi:hypothetical protein
MTSNGVGRAKEREAEIAHDHAIKTISRDHIIRERSICMAARYDPGIDVVRDRAVIDEQRRRLSFDSRVAVVLYLCPEGSEGTVRIDGNTVTLVLLNYEAAVTTNRTRFK